MFSDHTGISEAPNVSWNQLGVSEACGHGTSSRRKICNRVPFRAQITWQWTRGLATCLIIILWQHSPFGSVICCRKRSEPIGCWINLILNSQRFPQYVLWGRLADISPMWPQRNIIWVLVGIYSSWYFDYNKRLLTWLCVYFWLTDITLAILNSTCKSRVKSMTMLDDFQCLPSTYIHHTDWVHIVLQINKFLCMTTTITYGLLVQHHLLPPENVPGPWNAASECGQREKWLAQRITLSRIYVVYSTCLHFSENCWSPVTASPLHSKHMMPRAKIASRMYRVRSATWSETQWSGCKQLT